MRRTIKRTLIITSTETWTISIESSQPIEAVQPEETPSPITQAIATRGDDLLPQRDAEHEAADDQSVDEAQSIIEGRQD